MRIHRAHNGGNLVAYVSSARAARGVRQRFLISAAPLALLQNDPLDFGRQHCQMCGQWGGSATTLGSVVRSAEWSSTGVAGLERRKPPRLHASLTIRGRLIAGSCLVSRTSIRSISSLARCAHGKKTHSASGFYRRGLSHRGNDRPRCGEPSAPGQPECFAKDRNDLRQHRTPTTQRSLIPYRPPPGADNNHGARTVCAPEASPSCIGSGGPGLLRRGASRQTINRPGDFRRIPCRGWPRLRSSPSRLRSDCSDLPSRRPRYGRTRPCHRRRAE